MSVLGFKSEVESEGPCRGWHGGGSVSGVLALLREGLKSLSRDRYKKALGFGGQDTVCKELSLSKDLFPLDPEELGFEAEFSMERSGLSVMHC